MTFKHTGRFLGAFEK